MATAGLPALPRKRSATEVISPALNRMKHQLFGPSRFGKWMKLALIAILSGELSSGGCHFNFPANWSGRGSPESVGTGTPPDIEAVANKIAHWPHLLEAVLITVAVGFALGLLFMFINAVFRFILFDSVAYDRVEIAASWRRWSDAGGRFFLWMIVFDLLALAVMAVVVVIPLLHLVNSYRATGSVTAGGVGLMVLGVLGLMVVALLMVVCFVLAKDFLIPLMALEDLRAGEATRRLWNMLGEEKSGYFLYLIMKMILAIAAGIIMGIVGILVGLIVAIPFAAVGFVVIGSHLRTGVWDASAFISIGVLVALGIAALTLAMALVAVPVMVFFQSYVLYFFGDRYPRLGQVMQVSEPKPKPYVPPVAPYPIRSQ